MSEFIHIFLDAFEYVFKQHLITLENKKNNLTSIILDSDPTTIEDHHHEHLLIDGKRSFLEVGSPPTLPYNLIKKKHENPMLHLFYGVSKTFGKNKGEL